jgi:hypothetical protein
MPSDSSIVKMKMRRLRRRRTILATMVVAALVSALTITAFSVRTEEPATAAPPTGWNIVTSPATGGNDVLLGSTCANAFECWAVGVSIENINGGSNQEDNAIIDLWNGSSWAPVASPSVSGGNGTGLFSVSCVTSSDCWAVGAVPNPQGGSNGPLAENWNGSSWRIVSMPDEPGSTGAILHGVTCPSADDCWAVGSTTDDSGNPVKTVMEHWNGTSWALVTVPSTGQTYDQLNAVTCATASECFAVGSAGPNQQDPNFLPVTPAAVGDQAVIDMWNGSSWSIVPSYQPPSPEGSYLGGVTCVDADQCWASGSTTTSTDGTPLNALMEEWNGSSWTPVGVPNQPGADGSFLSDVSCISASQCWAAGSYGPYGSSGNGGFSPNSYIESWNGTAWSIEPSPDVTALSLLIDITCLKGDSCWAVGTTVTNVNGNGPELRTLIEQMTMPPQSNQGLILAAADGGIFAFGTASFQGSMGGVPLNQPIVGIARTPDGGGYWEVAADGGIFAFGDATFYGSMGGVPLNQPVVGIASTPDGRGYWEVAADGGIFAFGDAKFAGSMGGSHLNKPIVGMAAAPDGGGYWEVAADGGIFSFGSARFAGSLGSLSLNRPIVGMASTPDGGGYWLVGSDGGMFALGNAGYFGSVPGQGIVSAAPIVAVTPSPDGLGYWLVGSDGATYAYGSAAFLGSLMGVPLAAPVVGAAS